MTVSELVYKDNYTVDANGEQSQIVQSGLDLSVISEMSDDEIRAVIAQNADKFAAAGFTEQQALEAAAALKNGNIPDEVQAVISQFADALPVSAENTDADKDGDTDSGNIAQTSEPEKNSPDEESDSENIAQTSEPEKNSPDEKSDSENIAQTSEPEKGAPDVEGNR